MSVSTDASAVMDPYAAAGVDIAAGDDAVRRIAQHAHRTRRPGVLDTLGGFGAAFAPDLSAYPEPILVSATDGVGTKLLVAQAAERLHSIGIDLVAMCVNDVITTGAQPLFFLDYIATGSLDPSAIETIVSGIADGCIKAGCALVGGETAEMPGMYAPGAFDVAGFTVGMVNRPNQIRNEAPAGSVLVGIASSGVHSNGYSLVRALVPAENHEELHRDVPALRGQTLADALLEPTRIYVSAVLDICSRFDILGAAHITGGGLIENVPRMLAEGCGARIDAAAWKRPAIFDMLTSLGDLDTHTAHRVFNMGIGFVVAVADDDADGVIAACAAHGDAAWVIGTVSETPGVRLEPMS